jgi:hypothetical protein
MGFAMRAPSCPNCGRNQVRRTHRLGRGERLLSAIYVYPFRCQGCTRRFRALQWGVRYARLAGEVREVERLPGRLQATLDDGHTRAQGQTINVSGDGCSVETDVAFLPDTMVHVQILLPHGQRPVDVASAVVRASREGTVGVHFIRMDEESRQRLQRFLQGSLGQRSKPRPERWARVLRYRVHVGLWLTVLILLLLVLVLLILGRQFSVCTWGVNC